MRPITFLLAILTVAPFASVTAQEQPPPVKVGDRVRVTAVDLRINKRTGVLAAADSDTLTLDTLRVALASVIRFEVSRGRKSSSVARNAPIGVLLGGGIGALLGGALGRVLGGGEDSCPGCTAGFAGLGAATLGTVGLVVGIVTGSPRDRWEEVPLDRLRVSFPPQRDGRFGLGLSVRF